MKLEAGTRSYTSCALQAEIISYWNRILASGRIDSVGYRMPSWRHLIIVRTIIDEINGNLRIHLMDSESGAFYVMCVNNKNGVIGGGEFLDTIREIANAPLHVRLFMEDVGIITGLVSHREGPEYKIIEWPMGC